MLDAQIGSAVPRDASTVGVVVAPIAPRTRERMGNGLMERLKSGPKQPGTGKMTACARSFTVGEGAAVGVGMMRPVRSKMLDGWMVECRG